MESNPLEIASKEAKSTTNKRGRPIKAKLIQFSSPEPKSAIIAQILREKSLKKSLEETSEQCWQHSEIEDDFQSNEKELNRYKLKVQVVYETGQKRTNTRVNKKLKNCKAPKNNDEKRFACDFPDCTYAAKLSCNLVKHKRRHTSEKPYICDACPFRTNFINSLKVHRRIHTAEKPYNCECCGYRCNTSSNLKKHKMHRHSEVAKI